MGVWHSTLRLLPFCLIGLMGCGGIDRMVAIARPRRRGLQPLSRGGPPHEG